MEKQTFALGAELQGDRGPPSVLVIDDQKDQADLSAAILKTSSYQVEIAGSALEAIRLMAQRRKSYDLILLDLMMPRHSGLRVLDFLRYWIAGTRRPALVIYSSVTSWQERLQDAGYRVADYITKPIGPRALKERVKAALRTSQRFAKSSRKGG